MKIFGFLSKIKGLGFGGGKSQGVVGVDIGSSAIKVVELKRVKGKIALTKYGTLSLGPYAKSDIGVATELSTERLIDALVATLKAVEIESNRGAISVPLKLSLIVTLEVPETTQDNLEKIIPIEARKYIPVPPGEANIAWAVISGQDSKSIAAEKNKNSDGKRPTLQVLVAAIHNATIENYHEIAEKAGISPVLLEIETFSALRSVAGNEKEIFAMLDTGAEASKLIVSDNGSVAYSHRINRGSQSITHSLAEKLGVTFKEAEIIKRKYKSPMTYKNTNLEPVVLENSRFILEECKKAIKEYEQKHNNKIKKIILIGGGSLLSGFREKAMEILGIEAILGDSFSGIELPAKVLEPILKESGPEFAVAVGLGRRALDEL